ncbi:MocR-like transcription factor YczR [Desertihabitans brevis]|uniref:MocR-like transcription factor YczR n=1 Tax=Desertihabitans brevis TaxID=2268447 RepID=UPI0018F68EBA|nr:PLP-dependent aminotransferase family protein [Desertihabitans brevis]
MHRSISAPRVATLVGSGPWPAPAYRSLAAAVRRSVEDGRLPVGTRLPSERELTGAVGLSRTTVTRAYAELRSQGYLVTRRGSGSVTRVPDVPGGRVDHLLTPAGVDDVALDLTCTAPLAPAGVAEAYSRALDGLGAYLPGTGYYPSGLPVLRAAVAERFTRRGLPTSPDQVVVTTGALSAVAVAGATLLGRSDRVVLESPSYPNAIATLDGLARVVPHPLRPDQPGAEWDVEGLAALVRQVGPRAAYLIPDFHNPTGLLMDPDQREQVGRVLRTGRVVPVVDESLVELALDGAEVPAPLAAWVPDAITVGSASKSFWGGLRVGWLRAPDARLAELASTRLRLDLGAPVLEQLVVADLLGRAEEVLTVQRARLREGRDVLLAGLAEHLPDWRCTVPGGGMALWCELPGGSSTVLVRAAHRHGVALAAGPRFAPGGGHDRRLRLPHCLPVEQLAEVAPRLARAWAEARGTAGTDAADVPLIA